MTATKEPDYTRYSLEQLERARRSIDVERFPERTKILDILIADRKARAAELAEAAATGGQRREECDDECSSSRRGGVAVKTPGQALSAIFAFGVMGIGGAVMMWLSGMAEGEQRYFVLFWLLIALFQMGQYSLEYRRLKRETATTTAPLPTPVPPPITTAGPHRTDQPNASPVQRL